MNRKKIMGFGIKTKIIEYIKEEIYPHFGPEIIRINPIGYACTNSCPMCWRIMKKVSKKGGLRKDEIQWKNYKKLLDSLPFTVSTIEVVGGGEPLLFPKIESLLKKVKEKKVYASLITNGVVLTPKISRLLVRIGWDKVRVSINAGSKKGYLEPNGAQFFDRVVKNVEDLISMKKNTKVGLHFVIQKSNFKDINNFIKLSKKLKIDFINFDNLIYDSPEAIKLTKKETVKLKKILKKAKKEVAMENNIDEILKILKQGSSKRKKSYFKNKYCQIVQSNLDVSSEGNSVPCCMAYGEGISKNIKGKSILEVWKEFAPFRKRLKQGEFENFCYEKCNYHLKNKH